MTRFNTIIAATTAFMLLGGGGVSFAGERDEIKNKIKHLQKHINNAKKMVKFF